MACLMALLPARQQFLKNNMTIKLNDYWSQHLLKMPESGMGYQKVDLTLKNGRVLKNLIVLNAEDCQSDEKFSVEDISDIHLHKD